MSVFCITIFVAAVQLTRARRIRTLDAHDVSQSKEESEATLKVAKQATRLHSEANSDLGSLKTSLFEYSRQQASSVALLEEPLQSQSDLRKAEDNAEWFVEASVTSKSYRTAGRSTLQELLREVEIGRIEQKTTAYNDHPENVQQLLDMGIAEADARRVLAQAGGNVTLALELLYGMPGGSNEPFQDELQQIVGMGFAEIDARRVLAQTHGNVELAMELLLRENNGNNLTLPNAGHVPRQNELQVDLRNPRTWLLLAKMGDGALEKAVAFAPQIELGWFYLGVFGGGLVSGDLYSKVACFKKALELNPQDDDAWMHFGSEGGGKVAGTQYTKQACYEKALELNPRHVSAWINLGNEYGGLVAGERYTWMQCYTKAVTLDPSRSDAWCNFGYGGGGVVSDKQYNARQCFEQALTLDAKDEQSWINLGVEGGGKVKEKFYSEVDCLGQAITLNPRNVMAWDHLRKKGGGVVGGIRYTAEECLEHVDASAVRPNMDPACNDLYENLVLAFGKYQINFMWNPRDIVKHSIFARLNFGPQLYSLPRVFWCGFSHTRCTRKIVDEFASDVGGVDLEHEGGLLGKIMRKLKWGRDCHDKGDDKQFWISASKLFAEQSSLHFYMLINYHGAKLKESFLYKYESLIIRNECSEHPGKCHIVIVDFHTKCESPEVKDLMARLEVVHLACACPNCAKDISPTALDSPLEFMYDAATSSLPSLLASWPAESARCPLR